MKEDCRSGLDPAKIFTGADAAAFIGVPFADPRVPDVIGVAQVGTVYTGKTSKIAEHGGDNPQDRDVPIVVARLAHTGVSLRGT